MNPDSMSEADLIKSFTHDRPEPATQPPIERPARLGVNVCHVCGLTAAPEMFHPTKQECIKALLVRVNTLQEAILRYCKAKDALLPQTSEGWEADEYDLAQTVLDAIALDLGYPA